MVISADEQSDPGLLWTSLIIVFLALLLELNEVSCVVFHLLCNLVIDPYLVVPPPDGQNIPYDPFEESTISEDEEIIFFTTVVAIPEDDEVWIAVEDCS